MKDIRNFLLICVLAIAAYAMGLDDGKTKTITMAAPITVLAPHDSASILIRFAGDELHCFIVE